MVATEAKVGQRRESIPGVRDAARPVPRGEARRTQRDAAPAGRAVAAAVKSTPATCIGWQSGLVTTAIVKIADLFRLATDAPVAMRPSLVQKWPRVRGNHRDLSELERGTRRVARPPLPHEVARGPGRASPDRGPSTPRRRKAAVPAHPTGLLPHRKHWWVSCRYRQCVSSARPSAGSAQCKAADCPRPAMRTAT